MTKKQKYHYNLRKLFSGSFVVYNNKYPDIVRKTSHLFFLSFLLFLIACDGKEPYRVTKADWIDEAFATLTSGRYPRIKAIGWWHENFDDSQLRIDSSPESLEAYRRGVSDPLFLTTAQFSGGHLLPPDSGIYHSAFPDFGGPEDQVTAQRIRAFEQLAGKEIVWAYFSNNWGDHILFPLRSDTYHS